MRTRNKRIWAHLSDEEYAHFKMSVQKSGYTQERYLRALIGEHVPKAMPPLDFWKLMNAIYAVGNNMNQIAARANATGFIDAKQYKENETRMMEIVMHIHEEVCLPSSITNFPSRDDTNKNSETNESEEKEC